MALKFGSSSKSSTFKRQGFPMHSGTTSHSSALKEAKENKDKATSDRAVELALRNKELELQKKNEQLEKERAKKETKKELKKKGVKDDQGNYILGEFESADEKYDPKKDYSKPDPNLNLSPKAAKLAEKKNKKKEKERIKKDKEATAQEERVSSKTKGLEGKLSKTKTNKAYKNSEQYKLDKKEFNESDETNWTKFRNKKRDEWASDPKNAEAIRTSKSKKSDRQKEKLAESKMYDDMSIEQRLDYKQKKRDERDKRIRNTIATIDDIIPSQFGGGRGTSKVQEDDKLSDKKNFSDTDKDYISEAGKGSDKADGGIDTENEGGLSAEVNKTTTADEVQNNQKNENKGVTDNSIDVEDNVQDKSGPSKK